MTTAPKSPDSTSASLTRWNALDAIEKGLRLLTAFGYDTAPLWNEHNEWLKEYDTALPSVEDRNWATNSGIAPATADHFRDQNSLPEVLSAFRMAVGWHYVLTPGQRAYLRTRFGLTPAQTITVMNMETFPGSHIIRRFTIRSDEHVDNRRRRHVLNSVCLHSATEFFRRASELDKEAEADAASEAMSSPRAKSKAAKTPSIDALVKEYANLFE